MDEWDPAGCSESVRIRLSTVAEMSSRFSHTHIIWTTQLGYYLDAQDFCLRTWVLLHLLPASQTVVLNRNLPLTCPIELRTQWPLESPGQLCGFQSKVVLKAYVNFGRVPHIKLFAVLFAWSYILRKKRINHHCSAGSLGRACYAVLSNHQTEGPCTLQRHPMASKSPKLTSCTWKISWVTGHTWSITFGLAKWLLFTNARSNFNRFLDFQVPGSHLQNVSHTHANPIQ